MLFFFFVFKQKTFIVWKFILNVNIQCEGDGIECVCICRWEKKRKKMENKMKKKKCHGHLRVTYIFACNDVFNEIFVSFNFFYDSNTKSRRIIMISMTKKILFSLHLQTLHYQSPPWCVCVTSCTILKCIWKKEGIQYQGCVCVCRWKMFLKNGT